MCGFLIRMHTTETVHKSTTAVYQGSCLTEQGSRAAAEQSEQQQFTLSVCKLSNGAGPKLVIHGRAWWNTNRHLAGRRTTRKEVTSHLGTHAVHEVGSCYSLWEAWEVLYFGGSHELSPSHASSTHSFEYERLEVGTCCIDGCCIASWPGANDYDVLCAYTSTR